MSKGSSKGRTEERMIGENMKLQQQQHFQRKYSTLFAWLSAAENVCSFSLHVCFFLYTILLPPLLQNQPFFFINNSFFNLLFSKHWGIGRDIAQNRFTFLLQTTAHHYYWTWSSGQKVENILLLIFFGSMCRY